MSFLPTPAIPGAQPFPGTPGTNVEPPVINDEWFPDIDLAALRAACRLDGAVTAERLRHATVNALVNVNAQLMTWAAMQALAGFTHLSNVPAPVVDGQPATVHLYLRAVYAAVQCELIERYRDYDLSAKGDKRADAMDPRADEARRDLRWALADIQGARRVTVELI